VGSSFGFLTTGAEERVGVEAFSDSLSGYFAAAGLQATVVRMIDGGSTRMGLDAVSSADGAATALAASDVVIVDHEFRSANADRAVVEAIRRLRCPLIVRVRTVARVPTRYQRGMFDQVCQLADAVVVSSAAARRRLVAAYGVMPAKVVLIADGPRPLARVLDELAGVSVPTIVTSGFVAPDCGLETVIDAVAALRSLDPRPRYLIVGPTDAALLAREGEAYRHALMARTIDRGVAPMVHFSSTLLDAPDVARADVVIVAHVSREQLQSRVVAGALAAGTPVVALVTAATSGLAAAAGIERLVRADDPAALARILRFLLTDPLLVATVAHRNIDQAPMWARIATQYQALAAELISARRLSPLQDPVTNVDERRTSAPAARVPLL
jgi:polysaccharide biosynthesis protein PslF